MIHVSITLYIKVWFYTSAVFAYLWCSICTQVPLKGQCLVCSILLCSVRYSNVQVLCAFYGVRYFWCAAAFSDNFSQCLVWSVYCSTVWNALQFAKQYSVTHFCQCNVSEMFSVVCIAVCSSAQWHTPSCQLLSGSLLLRRLSLRPAMWTKPPSVCCLDFAQDLLKPANKSKHGEALSPDEL